MDNRLSLASRLYAINLIQEIKIRNLNMGDGTDKSAQEKSVLVMPFVAAELKTDNFPELTHIIVFSTSFPETRIRKGQKRVTNMSG